LEVSGLLGPVQIQVEGKKMKTIISSYADAD